MPAIRFEHVTKEFSSEGSEPKAAVHDVSLEVEEGEIVVLLGPSGCGKTTLLRMVNRLIEPTSGQIYVDGVAVTDISATTLRRRIGYVIQQTGLFPHMTVAANVATVPRLLGWPKARIEARIDEMLTMMDLPPAEYRKRYPRQLSGGQQQRVGIARAMAADPSVLLMDEPFGAIDAITRADLQNELLKIQHQISKTIMFVTHDVEEALRLADCIAVMREGEVVQYGKPLELLDHPVNAFVQTLLNTDDVFRQLSLVPIQSLMTPFNGNPPTELSLPAEVDSRQALSLLISRGAQELTVRDREGRAMGRVTLQDILSSGSSQQIIVDRDA